MNTPEQTQLFNNYLADTLSEEEKIKFENELEMNPETATAFEKHRQILEGIGNARRAYFQLYRDIEGEQPFSEDFQQQGAPWYVWVLIAFMILGIFWLVSTFLV